LIPTGDDVTVPDPDPAFDTVKVRVCNVKVAVTFLAAVIDTVHVVPVPEHAPDQPEKEAPVPGCSVNTTVVPSA